MYANRLGGSTFMSRQSRDHNGSGGLDGTARGDGATWTPATGKSDDGRRLRRVETRRLYAFAWQDDHGTDAFYAD